MDTSYRGIKDKALLSSSVAVARKEHLRGVVTIGTCSLKVHINIFGLIVSLCGAVIDLNLLYCMEIGISLKQNGVLLFNIRLRWQLETERLPERQIARLPDVQQRGLQMQHQQSKQ
jgi:hypothetical protein